MTIPSGVLATSPTIYWKMDDPTGPAASDSSGNGHAGFFLSNTFLNADGPEVGTKAIASSTFDGGVQLVGANPLTGTGPFSMQVWISPGTTFGTDKVLVYNGTSNLNGEGVLGSFQNTLDIIRGGLEVAATGQSLSVGKWQMVTHTFQNGGNRLTYVNAVQVDSHPAGTPIGTTSSDPVLAQTPGPALLAHAAFWNRVLSPTEITAMFTAGPGAGVVGNTGQTGSPGAIVQTNDSATLALILAAVQKTFPRT